MIFYTIRFGHPTFSFLFFSDIISSKTASFINYNCYSSNSVNNFTLPSSIKPNSSHFYKNVHLILNLSYCYLYFTMPPNIFIHLSLFSNLKLEKLINRIKLCMCHMIPQIISSVFSKFHDIIISIKNFDMVLKLYILSV